MAYQRGQLSRRGMDGKTYPNDYIEGEKGEIIMDKDIMRDSTLDIMRAIGMILVVMAHSFCPFRMYYMSYYMSVFFILSGYCYNTKHSQNLKSIRRYILRNAKRFYFPYVVFNVVFILLHNPLSAIQLIPDEPYSFSTLVIRLIRACLFCGSEGFAGATWFIRVLFFSLPMFAFAHYIFNNRFNKKYIVTQVLLSVLILILVCRYASFESGQISILITTILAAYVMLFLGECIRRIRGCLINIMADKLSKAKMVSDLAKKPYMQGGGYFISAIFFGGLTIIANRFGIVFWGQDFINPILFVFVSLSGFGLLWSVSRIMGKVECLSSAFQYIGENTLVILFFHSVAFKILNIILVVAYQMDSSNLAETVIVMEEYEWWIIYTIVGVTIPLLLKKVWSEIIYE